MFKGIRKLFNRSSVKKEERFSLDYRLTEYIKASSARSFEKFSPLYGYQCEAHVFDEGVVVRLTFIEADKAENKLLVKDGPLADVLKTSEVFNEHQEEMIEDFNQNKNINYFYLCSDHSFIIKNKEATRWYATEAVKDVDFIIKSRSDTLAEACGIKPGNKKPGNKR